MKAVLTKAQNTQDKLPFITSRLSAVVGCRKSSIACSTLSKSKLFVGGSAALTLWKHLRIFSEDLLNKWNRQCTYCKAENVPFQVEHIVPKAKGGTNRISNLCLACESCNLKKGTQDIAQFLSKKPELLRQIQIQAKRPLKDAAAVNSTRWALFSRLKETGLPVSTGSGGQTKFNRTRLGLPKAHWLDAACVGKVTELKVLTTQPLKIKATGNGSRRQCRTDKYGFPSRYVPKNPFVKGFQTGDIVKAIVTKGKKIGDYLGRVAVRSVGSFNVSDKAGLIDSVSYKYCTLIHKKDGYGYAL